MKIALITSKFPSREHPYIWDWTKALVDRGIDLTILTESFIDTPKNNDESNIELLERIITFNSVLRPVHSISKNRARILRTFKSPLRLQNAISVLKAKEKKKRSVVRKSFEYFNCILDNYDLVHFNAPQIAIRRLELGLIYNAPVLVSFRGQDFTFHPSRYDQLLQEANYLHFISKHLVQEAQKRGYPGGKHTLIPPMVDTNFFVPSTSKVEEKSFSIFTAARLTWTKGWEFALKAIALLVEKGWDIHYYIAGDGELRDLVIYTIHELGLDERVHLLGWLPPAEIRTWMQKSQVYLLASVEEAFNNSVLQAQASGVPVVCADTGGLSENIQDEVTGYLARRRDAWDMAEKIEKLLLSPDLRVSMGEAGRKRAVEEFDIQNVTSKFVDLYMHICQ